MIINDEKYLKKLSKYESDIIKTVFSELFEKATQLSN